MDAYRNKLELKLGQDNTKTSFRRPPDNVLNCTKKK